ncbi:hypothetical protein HZA38_03545 [Candidatus Peregrinibacteria bacterium]|nr:hypothetical protein [Candidatus Peregrinibacteria bacterium]
MGQELKREGSQSGIDLIHELSNRIEKDGDKLSPEQKSWAGHALRRIIHLLVLAVSDPGNQEYPDVDVGGAIWRVLTGKITTDKIDPPTLDFMRKNGYKLGDLTHLKRWMKQLVLFPINNFV